MGAEKQAKGRQTGNQPVKPPPGYRYLLYPVPPGASPPAGVSLFLSHLQCRFPPNPGDARGEAPCIRKL